MTSTNGQGHTKTPRRIWLRVAGGGTTMPSMKPYVTMVGDDRPADHHIEYVRADLLRESVEALQRLVDAGALAGVRKQVAGWNGEGLEQPHMERHPSKLGATLPKTTCGAVYELDDAMQAARAALSRVSGEDR